LIEKGLPCAWCFAAGGALWTVAELLFESKKLIPALQQLFAQRKKVYCYYK